MGKQKSRSSRVSNGGRQKANVAHEAKRQEKFAAKRGTDKEYRYRPNPYDPKTQTELWAEENYNRKQKAKSSKLPYARLASIFAKLDNDIAKENLARKEMSGNKNNKN